MQADYLVNSSVAEEVAVTVDLNGQATEAKVSGVVLELVAPDGRTSLTFRYVPADVAAELAAFPPGQAVRVSVDPLA